MIGILYWIILLWPLLCSVTLLHRIIVLCIVSLCCTLCNAICSIFYDLQYCISSGITSFLLNHFTMLYYNLDLHVIQYTPYYGGYSTALHTDMTSVLQYFIVIELLYVPQYIVAFIALYHSILSLYYSTAWCLMLDHLILRSMYISGRHIRRMTPGLFLRSTCARFKVQIFSFLFTFPLQHRVDSMDLTLVSVSCSYYSSVPIQSNAWGP